MTECTQEKEEEEPFTRAELEAATKKLNRGKALGLDQITSEMIEIPVKEILELEGRKGDAHLEERKTSR